MKQLNIKEKEELFHSYEEHSSFTDLKPFEHLNVLKT